MAKEAINLIAEEETYKNLITFSDIEDMNKTVRHYKDIIKEEVKRKDLQGNLLRLLEMIKRHSCKYLGVSFLSKNSLAEKLELSYKTVQRLMKRLGKMNIIKEYAMKRKSNMYQTANAVIIQPLKNDKPDKEPPKKEEKCPSKTTTILSKTKNINTYKERNVIHNNTNTDNNIKNAEFVAHWVPARFTALSSSYFSKAKDIEEFWKVVKQNNRPVNGDKLFSKAQEIEIGMKAVKEFVMKYKGGVSFKKSMFAYFNGIVDKLMTKFYFDDDFMTQN